MYARLKAVPCVVDTGYAEERLTDPSAKSSVLDKQGTWIYCPQRGYNSRSQQFQVLHSPEPRLIVGKSNDSL